MANHFDILTWSQIAIRSYLKTQNLGVSLPADRVYTGIGRGLVPDEQTTTKYEAQTPYISIRALSAEHDEPTDAGPWRVTLQIGIVAQADEMNESQFHDMVNTALAVLYTDRIESDITAHYSDFTCYEINSTSQEVGGGGDVWGHVSNFEMLCTGADVD